MSCVCKSENSPPPPVAPSTGASTHTSQLHTLAKQHRLHGRLLSGPAGSGTPIMLHVLCQYLREQLPTIRHLTCLLEIAIAHYAPEPLPTLAHNRQGYNQTKT